MNSLNIATKNDLPNIVEMFHLYLDIFPHIRNDYIERNIKKRNVIYENEVVIIYTKPAIFFDNNGKLKETGCGEGKIIFSLPMALVLSSIFVYFIIKTLNN